MNGQSHDQAGEIRGYVTGYLMALVLSAAAFAVIQWPRFGVATSLAIVCGLALSQTVIHFYFFLHVGLRKSAREDLWLVLFSTLIIVMMVSGTLLIMIGLRHRMM